jgi:hypothetical protein
MHENLYSDQICYAYVDRSRKDGQPIVVKSVVAKDILAADSFIRAAGFDPRKLSVDSHVKFFLHNSKATKTVFYDRNVKINNPAYGQLDYMTVREPGMRKPMLYESKWYINPICALDAYQHQKEKDSISFAYDTVLIRMPGGSFHIAKNRRDYLALFSKFI